MRVGWGTREALVGTLVRDRDVAAKGSFWKGRRQRSGAVLKRVGGGTGSETRRRRGGGLRSSSGDEGELSLKLYGVAER